MGWDYIAGRKVRRKTSGHKSPIGTDVTAAPTFFAFFFLPLRVGGKAVVQQVREAHTQQSGHRAALESRQK